jgi:16S rRNA G527 N7-methylase RsmG
MVESKERKSAFLREVARTLGLAGTVVLTARFEEVATSPEYLGKVDLITVRAVKTDHDLFETAGKLLSPSGHLLLFRPAHAASADPHGFRRLSTVPLIESPQSFLSVYQRASA